MSHTVDDILRDALLLPPEERVRLAHELLLSLEKEDAKSEACAEWPTELERRAQDVVSGKVKTYDARQVIEEVRTQIRVRRGG